MGQRVLEVAPVAGQGAINIDGIPSGRSHPRISEATSELAAQRSVSRAVFVLGTRPEAIKLAPVIHACSEHPAIEPVVVAVRQHDTILDQALDCFGVTPDRTVRLTRAGTGLGHLTSEILSGLGDVVVDENPDIVLVQGDTTTALTGALAAFYERVPIAHVEAGLRTLHLSNPYPEELNRQMIARMADLHFAPTEGAKQNLVNEGIAEHKITVVGNTVIDALRMIRQDSGDDPASADGPHRLLVTAHRRESWSTGLDQICRAVSDICLSGLDVEIVFVAHPNPAIAERVRHALRRCPHVRISGPLPYREFVTEMAKADLILTDSGGIQEEAPALGKSVLVMRERTERIEGVEAGDTRLVGVDRRQIRRAALSMLVGPRLRVAEPRPQHYGDGFAAQRIVTILDRHLNKDAVRARKGADAHGGEIVVDEMRHRDGGGLERHIAGIGGSSS